MLELHEKMGHLSGNRVETLIRKRFYWPNLRGEVDDFIRNKCLCVFPKKPNVTEKAELIPIKATYPFEIIAIDFLKLEKCKGGFEYVLVVCDHFTRFSQAFTTRSKSSKAAADKLFNNFILTFGFPTRIHHDRGPEFNSTMFHQLHKLSGIRSSNTTPYHPLGDGNAERFNRTLINMLKSIPEHQKKNWKEMLPQLTFAYNATVNATTGYSPFFLMFGREPILSVDRIFPSVRCETDTKSYERFVSNWKNRMSAALSLAKRAIEKTQDYNKQWYDGKVRSIQIAVGDRVLVRNVRNTGKLDSYWERNIYEVINKVDDLPVYKIKKLNSKGVVDPKSKIRKLHRNLLKKVNELEISDDSVVPIPRKKSNVLSKPTDTVDELESDESEEVIVYEENGDVMTDRLPVSDIDEEASGNDVMEGYTEPNSADVVTDELPVTDVDEEVSDNDGDVLREYTIWNSAGVSTDRLPVILEVDEEVSGDDYDVSEEDTVEDSRIESVPRRSSRIKVKKQTFTYDEVGGKPLRR